MMEDKRIDELIQILETSSSEYTRIQAAYSLSKIAIDNQKVILALVNLLETTTHENTRTEVTYCLGKIATGDEKAISALVRVLIISTDESTRRRAAESLGQIGKGDERAIFALVNLMETTINEWTCRQAAESLGQIGKGDERAISALVKLLETSTNWYTRQQAAASLGQIGKGDERAISALVKLLATSTNESTRQRAAYILGAIVGISPHLLLKSAPIASLLKRQWLGYILLIFAIFGWLGLLALLILQNSGFLILSNDTITLLSIFLFLIPLFWLINKLYLKKIFFRWFNRQRNQEVAVWLEVLSSQDEFIQWQVIQKIGAIASGSKSAIVALIDTLNTSKNEFIQWQAVKSLRNIGNNNRKALTAIIKFIKTTSNEFVQWQSLEELHHFNVLHFSNILQIRNQLKSNSSPSINSTLLKLQKKIAPLERLMLKPFNQKLIKESRQEYSVKTIFGDIIVNYIDRMQEGRDITHRRILINHCLKTIQYLVKYSLKNKDFNRAFFYTELFRNRYLVERIAQQDADLPQSISRALAQQVQTAKQTERQTLQNYTDASSKHRPETELETLSKAWENAKQTLENLYGQVAEIEPEFIAKTKVYPIHFEEVQHLLPADTAIIEFFFTETELITLLIPFLYEDALYCFYRHCRGERPFAPTVVSHAFGNLLQLHKELV